MDKDTQKSLPFTAESQRPHIPIDQDAGASDHSPVASPVTFETSLLALASIPGLGTKGIISICEALSGDLTAVWHTDPHFVQEALSRAKVRGVDKISRSLREDRDRLIGAGIDRQNALREIGVSLLTRTQFPDLLRRLPDSPHWLFVQGNAEALFGRPAIAVVGTRDPTRKGLDATGIVCRMLSAYDITVVSGLANGIDAAAHVATLRNNLTNVAFLGHGVNVWFPEETNDIRRRILAQGGAVASEYLPDDHYRRQYFVQRNRLQAGLSDLVIPVEAHPSGGTAHTARFASQYGKSILGIKWPGCDGIVTELESAGKPVIDITNADGQQALDSMLQRLAREHGKESYPLRMAEHHLAREAASRALGDKDASRYLEAARDILEKEVSRDRGN